MPQGSNPPPVGGIITSGALTALQGSTYEQGDLFEYKSVEYGLAVEQTDGDTAKIRFFHATAQEAGVHPFLFVDSTTHNILKNGTYSEANEMWSYQNKGYRIEQRDGAAVAVEI